MRTTNCRIHPAIQEWIDIVEKQTYACCKDQIALVRHVKKCFQKEKIHIDAEQLEKYLGLQKYFPYKFFAWENFVVFLHLCVYWDDTGMPRWPDLFLMAGRGAGKDGVIAYESLCVTSPYNPIREYDVDICGNAEEQAMRPVLDLINFFEQPKNEKKLKKHYKWLKQLVTSKKNHSAIKGRTNNPKSKDGLRSGIVMFNELHQYENYDNINVFVTGLGKKPHPRTGYYTTNGDVREGPLDDLITQAEGILFNGDDDNGLLPAIFRLDDKKEVHDEKMWTKANPSLPYLPHLLHEIQKEYRTWKEHPERLPAFMSKRMNRPDGVKESGVTKWEYISATNKELPDMTGWSCTVGIDYVKTTDWASVNLHFKQGERRYDINHSWICRDSKDLKKIKAPWQDWVKKGYCTFVDDVEVHADTLAEYIQEMGCKYNIKKVAIDGYRYQLMAGALSKIGFTKERGNLKLVSQMDIMRLVPVVESCFVNQYYSWGDCPPLRWGVNNTKLIPYGKQKGNDKGSFVYGKIEAKSRKTDPWMALVASQICEDEIICYQPIEDDAEVIMTI